ncbi:MAG: hypothetical protein QOK40_1173 [Miltoncostaeaceae bacterium]|jgi:hypothetical protein|nr:hypothetical protein [Miltoncostaeaceae bacterium]
MTRSLTGRRSEPGAGLGAHHAALRAEGYRPGRPDRHTALEDAGVCMRAVCPRCHARGLVYRPYIHPVRRAAGGGYRALAVCAACGAAEEF